MSATATIVLDTRRMKKKKGKFPVKLLVIYKSEPKIQRKVEDFVTTLHPFSYAEFEKDLILDHPDFRQRKFIKNW